jgi:ribonucleoside-diphosphate reductase subunit M1
LGDVESHESTEPFTYNMYNRRVLAGEFTVVNKHLLRELTDMGIWTDSVRNRIIAENGSVQNVPEIPKEVRDIYKTVWEIPQDLK